MRWGSGCVVAGLAVACGSSTSGGAGQAGNAGALAAGAGGAGAAGASTTGGVSGATTTGSGGATGGGGQVLTGTTGVIHFGSNDLCLPEGVSLPASSAASLAPCRLIFTGVTGGCSQAGLSVATAQDKASVVAEASALQISVQDPMCQLTQLTAHTGAECAAASDSGWCYADGACTATGHACDHALCATPAFNQLMLAYEQPSWLVCD